MEIIRAPTTSNNNLAPALIYTVKRMYERFNVSCLKVVGNARV